MNGNLPIYERDGAKHRTACAAQRVIDSLESLLSRDLSFVAAVQDSLSNMQLGEELQQRCLGLMLAQLPAVDVEDLPGLVRWVGVFALPCPA